MIRAIHSPHNISVHTLVEQIIAAGHMSRDQHVLLTSAILSNQRIDEYERHQVNRVLDYLQTGRVKLIDPVTYAKSA